jgi:hypothetical protein
VPPGATDLFSELAEEEFSLDISSTDLRGSAAALPKEPTV